MTLLSLVLISTGCEDKIDSPTVNLSEGKTVEVTLNLGIADEEDGAGATASPTSKAGSNSRSALEAFLFMVCRPNQEQIFLTNSTIWKYGNMMEVESRLAVKH